MEQERETTSHDVLPCGNKHDILSVVGLVGVVSGDQMKCGEASDIE